MDYKYSLNLPKTRFKMKANLPQKEPQRIKKWDDQDTYSNMVSGDDSRPRFILHDGPPYANGHIHSGTVLNKILKDFVVKYKNMTGFRCEYIPGWDCHGLPIENNVEREEGKGRDEFSVPEFRRKCEKYAHRFVKIQKKEFKRLGVLGDWDNPYLTVHRSYEATIAREFGKVVESGALYKRKKPVYWCAHHVTALADAEVEYEDLSSPSIYVKFQLNADALEKLPALPHGKSVYAVIWTTTPWTLPANLAITLHPELEYSILECDEEVYLVATERASEFARACRLEAPNQLGIVRGDTLEGTTARHPFVERDSLFILGDFVTTETGTGCVHTAPGHGADDYEAGLRYGLDAYAPVDDKGCFTADVPQFQGRYVFETDDDIVSLLKEKGALLSARSYRHSYPVCQRCRTPIVFRATSQWFISMDKSRLREKALGVIPKVEWIPGRGEQRITSMVETRPDWCLSRQRLWGVPIIALYCKQCGEVLLDADLVYHVADIFEKEGAGAWFRREVADLLPEGTRCGKCSASSFERETDIVDVWFESGVSYAAVIENRYGEGTVADLYLEGSDQHRGWFQSSLLESIISRDRAPYVTVLTHGFVVDGEGKKISKTLGNFVPPEEIIAKNGAEIYRLWVAAENYQEDVRISDEILRTLVDAYLKIRNTFRYLLGNLAGFDPSADVVNPEEMLPLDQYALHRTAVMAARVTAAYESYRFHEIFQTVTKFLSVELSAFYLDIVKDRLYVMPPFSKERRSARSALYQILDTLVRLLAPICSFTCEEVWEHMPHLVDAPESVFQVRIPADLKSRFFNARVAAEFEQLLAVRELVTKDLELKRRDKVVGHSLDAAVHITVGRQHPSQAALSKYREMLGEFFIVSGVTVEVADGDDLTVSGLRAAGDKCSRCWHWSETTGTDEQFEEVCERCAGVLEQLKSTV